MEGEGDGEGEREEEGEGRKVRRSLEWDLSLSSHDPGHHVIYYRIRQVIESASSTLFSAAAQVGT